MFKKLTDKYNALTGQQKTILNYALVLLLCVVGIIAANLLFKKATAEQLLAEHQKNSSEVLGVFQKNAQIATTEVKLKRIAVYDSDTEFSGINPTNWKLGRRACIMPVEITVKYGIDLNKMQPEDVVIDSANIARIRLPQPEVITYDVEPRINPDDVITITTLTRSDVGEPTLRKVKEKAVEEMMADTTVFSKLSAEIESNTERVLGSMVRALGLEPQFIK